MDHAALFLDHLRERQAYLEQGLAATGFEALVISSGQAAAATLPSAEWVRPSSHAWS